jgi:hypothetical protein
MPAKKHDYIIVCDSEDSELAELLGDWLDANMKTVEVVSYDSSEHLQFPVQIAQASKKGRVVILCLTDHFLPLRFPLPQFQSCIAADPDCSKGKILAVAMRPLTETEVIPVLSIIDAHSGELSQNRRRFVERAVAATAPAKKRAVRKSPPPAPGTTIHQHVGKARDVLAAGRDINYSPKKVTKNVFTPDERHITAAQATKIKKLVDDLVEMDVSAGKTREKSYPAWWGYINSSMDVTTYREIRLERFDEAVLLLQQANARNLPKIRRKDNELWRKKHYATIFGIGKKALGWTDEEIHSFASSKLKKTVESMADVGEQDLARIARMIRAESKKR